MSRRILVVTLVPLAWACASSAGTEWQRADGSPETEAIREQRAKDLADCATMVGAPTPGGQSTMSLSRGQAEDCMRKKGWQRISVPPG